MIALAWAMFKNSKQLRVVVYAVAGALLFMLALWYFKASIISNYEASKSSELWGRVNDAISAGDHAVRDPDRLREDDGHRRD